MDENMVSTSKDEYKATLEILELACKAEMLKEVLLDSATLDYYGKGLYFGSFSNDVATIFKYAFPEDYESKLRELVDKKKAADNEEGADDER